jgi:hypothetical protein
VRTSPLMLKARVIAVVVSAAVGTLASLCILLPSSEGNGSVTWTNAFVWALGGLVLSTAVAVECVLVVGRGRWWR